MNVGHLLMAANGQHRHNSHMNASDTTPTIDAPDDQPAKPPAAVEREAESDERDETIRLLNEALSRALDELQLEQAA